MWRFLASTAAYYTHTCSMDPRDFSLQNRSDGLCGPPSLLVNGYGVLSKGWSDSSAKLASHLHLVPRLRMSADIHRLPPIRFHDVDRDNSTFFTVLTTAHSWMLSWGSSVQSTYLQIHFQYQSPTDVYMCQVTSYLEFVRKEKNLYEFPVSYPVRLSLLNWTEQWK
jgi:hypothetical protein